MKLITFKQPRPRITLPESSPEGAIVVELISVFVDDDSGFRASTWKTGMVPLKVLAVEINPTRGPLQVCYRELMINVAADLIACVVDTNMILSAMPPL